MFKKQNLQKVMSMEVEKTSVGMSQRTLESYTADWRRIHRVNFYRQIKILLPNLWRKEIKDKEQYFYSYQTIEHLIYINNEGVHYFIKFN